MSSLQSLLAIWILIKALVYFHHQLLGQLLLGLNVIVWQIWLYKVGFQPPVIKRPDWKRQIGKNLI